VLTVVKINNESEVAVPAAAILALDPNVIAPDHVLFPLGFLMAPWVVAIPSPLIVIGSGIFKLFPNNCIVAPDTTVVVPLVAPNALLLWAFKVPAETLIAPA
jgi:hypothetical protein